MSRICILFKVKKIILQDRLYGGLRQFSTAEKNLKYEDCSRTTTELNKLSKTK